MNEALKRLKNLKHPYMCADSELRMCEDEMIRTRKNLEISYGNFERATNDDERAKFDAEISKFEIWLRNYQKRHAQLVITKFAGGIGPFGKLTWKI